MIRVRYTRNDVQTLIEVEDAKCDHGYDVLILAQKHFAPQSWEGRVDVVASRLIAEQRKAA